MSKKTTVAIAGAGMISRHHLVAWSKIDSIQVIAIADPAGDKARLRASEFGIWHAFEDVDDMLDRLRPDILDIASPVETHAGIARTAARHRSAVPEAGGTDARGGRVLDDGSAAGPIHGA